MNNITEDHAPKQTSFNVKDEFQCLPLDQIKQVAESNMLGYSIALANVTGDLNIGFIVRTAACLCANKVMLFGRRKWDRRSAVGSNVYVPVEAYQTDTEPFDWDGMFQTIRINGYTPILIEQNGAPLETLTSDVLSSIDSPCLVFGSESIGIPNLYRQTELCFEIPQPGVIRSLNVASAAAIAIHHVFGLLNTPVLD